ncbi:MAG: dephospho-CoA kinase [Legionella sp.]|uniref:dephospho-CoA kinase n=1 Tax=Legionella sp. TaxID=459 RepID=UPI0039E21B21
MVYCVGLTGGIACGKSAVAALFASRGVSIINADQISRDLTAKGQEALDQIVAHFGHTVLTATGELNRKTLREIIFSNTEERVWLEQLLHPLIRQHIKKQVEACPNPYCIAEIPLLIDKTHYPYINRILLITAPLKTQISRIMQRDNCSQKQAQAILAIQPNLNVRLQYADDILENDGTLIELKFKVNKLHQRYLQLAQK